MRKTNCECKVSWRKEWAHLQTGGEETGISKGAKNRGNLNRSRLIISTLDIRLKWLRRLRFDLNISVNFMASDVEWLLLDKGIEGHIPEYFRWKSFVLKLIFDLSWEWIIRRIVVHLCIGCGGRLVNSRNTLNLSHYLLYFLQWVQQLLIYVRSIWTTLSCYSPMIWKVLTNYLSRLSSLQHLKRSVNYNLDRVWNTVNGLKISHTVEYLSEFNPKRCSLWIDSSCCFLLYKSSQFSIATPSDDERLRRR